MKLGPPTPGKTLFIILGASEFPKSPMLAQSEAFLASAQYIAEYLVDVQGFGLPEENLLNLFNSPKAPSDLDTEISQFLDSHTKKQEDQSARDVIIYYIGHGDFSYSEYFLALNSTRKDSELITSYQIKSLANTLKNNARHLRKYLILDCCFSASALKEFQGSGPLQAAIQKVKVEFEETIEESKHDVEADGNNIPPRGTSILCAASASDFARSPEKEPYTMFSGALIEILENGIYGIPQKLNLSEMCQEAWQIIKKKYKDRAVRPESHSPEQKYGDVAKVPLFPVPYTNKIKVGLVSDEKDSIWDPLDSFISNSLFLEEVHCLVITSEQKGEERGFPLEEHVRRAFENYGEEIHSAVKEFRQSYRSEYLPSQCVDETPFLTKPVLSKISIAKAFQSSDALRQSIQAICKADITIFDITDFQPGVMLLLGIRSVARRGVTLCSMGGDYFIGAELDLPFNLQALNIAAHSDFQVERGPDPLALIGEKIITGFKEMANLPHYLDLPAYDSVRRLGTNSWAYKPIQFYQQVLVLCPFSESYTKRNWNFFLSKELPVKLKRHFQKNEDKEISPPKLLRLLDQKTPRLVAQTLYEAIRLTEMCIIDWTHLRPNVMYEMGVRFATNPLGGVHIIEQIKSGQQIIPESSPSHANDLMKMFKPISYYCKPGETQAYNHMINAHLASLESGWSSIDKMIYETVGVSLDKKVCRTAIPVLEELMQSANLLSSEDQMSTGISPVLYHDVNKEILEEALDAAGERRLAAWLYLDHRYEVKEILENDIIYEKYRLLGSQVRQWLKKNSNNRLEDYVKARMKILKEIDLSKDTGDIT